jgi:hypothetical protein
MIRDYMLNFALKRGEGLMIKALHDGSSYEPNKRSDKWYVIPIIPSFTSDSSHLTNAGKCRLKVKKDYVAGSGWSDGFDL